MSKVPSFFTFFKAEMDKTNMVISKAFTQRIKKPFPETVLLRDRNNRIWTVKMKKIGDRWYFSDGWNKFVNDNSLTSRELLVFAFHENYNLFNVKLYGTHATEKNITAPYMEVSEAQETNDDESTESESYEQRQIVLNNVNNDESGGENRQGRGMPRSLYPKCYGMEIFEAGLAVRPINPYFVTQIMPKRRTSLLIPQHAVKDYKLSLGEEIILVDPEGREFPSACNRWNDERYVVLGGWAPLCRVNHVNEADKCICEFLQREGDHRQFLYINFVRLNA